MELEGSLWCSQEPASGPCRETDGSSPNPTLSFVKISFNIILPSIQISCNFLLHISLKISVVFQAVCNVS
jgi:hypothetical protein